MNKPITKESWKEYKQYLDLSDTIINRLKGDPKTHAEWASRFNEKGHTAREIMKFNKNNHE